MTPRELARSPDLNATFAERNTGSTWLQRPVDAERQLHAVSQRLNARVTWSGFQRRSKIPR